jgi:hypothetical protein
MLANERSLMSTNVLITVAKAKALKQFVEPASSKLYLINLEIVGRPMLIAT